MVKKLLSLSLISVVVSIAYMPSASAKESFLNEIKQTFASRPQSAPATAEIEIGFSPDAGAEDLVIKAISSAKKTIRLAAYSFTSKPVIQALIAAKRRGVDVKCVLDKSNTKSKSGIAGANLIVNAGIPTMIDSQHAIAHSKYIVIDDAHVETGSFNYSAAAAHKNAENVIVIWQNPSVAKTYSENWSSHWDHSEEFKSTY